MSAVCVSVCVRGRPFIIKRVRPSWWPENWSWRVRTQILRFCLALRVKHESLEGWFSLKTKPDHYLFIRRWEKVCHSSPKFYKVLGSCKIFNWFEDSGSGGTLLFQQQRRFWVMKKICSWLFFFFQSWISSIFPLQFFFLYVFNILYFFLVFKKAPSFSQLFMATRNKLKVFGR